MNDLRFAFRQLLKNSGFTAVVAATLALGIGFNTTLFSALNTLLFRVVPFADADRLVRIYRVSQQEDRAPLSVANALDYIQQTDACARMAAFFWSSLIFAEPGQPPERVLALTVTGDFFDVFAVPPELGRTLQPSDAQPGNENVVVLSHRFWQRRFGGDPHLLGRTVRLEGRPVTVVGVMPAACEAVTGFYRLPSFPFVNLAVLGYEIYFQTAVRNIAPESFMGRIAPVPVLIIAGEGDEMIPAENGRRLFRATKEPKELWIIPVAGHGGTIAAAGDEYGRRLGEFFDRHLRR